MAHNSSGKISMTSPLSEALSALKVELYSSQFEYTRVGELLGHYPLRYDQFGQYSNLENLRVDEQITIVAQVISRRVIPMKSRKGLMMEIMAGDSKGNAIPLMFFASSPWVLRPLKVGLWGMFSGKVTDVRGRLQLTKPAFKLIDGPEDDTGLDQFAGKIIPIYPVTAKVESWKLAADIARILKKVELTEASIPDMIAVKHGLNSYHDALHWIHAPNSLSQLPLARRRLKWQEAMVMQTSLLQRKRANTTTTKPRPEGNDNSLFAFDQSLPFTLTEGQKQTGQAITEDLGRVTPMHRLLQGDVGSGKTVVAVRAMLQVAATGGQSALLAPTEVLAAQHFRSIKEMMAPMGDEATSIELLTGSTTSKERRRITAGTLDGTVTIIVGTHALIYDGVDFNDLGLVIIDEQHRFGVEQREKLRTKAGHNPHTLVMTATPIPRSIAMTVYGDLDTSRMEGMPEGRIPIATHPVPLGDPRYFNRMWERVVEEIKKGHQAYVVCPRVGEADNSQELTLDNIGEFLDSQFLTITKEFSPSTEDSPRETMAANINNVYSCEYFLKTGPLKGHTTAVLHGKMNAGDKEQIMRDFEQGNIDVLVATTVIEVGVNVPNATVIVIADADRFGISQLHQLRGRVGRGRGAGLCFLLSDADRHTPAMDRLEGVAATTDGFVLAEQDLRSRKEGDVLGVAQSGTISHLKILSLIEDQKIIQDARTEAAMLLDADPHLEHYTGLRDEVILVESARGDYLNKGLLHTQPGTERETRTTAVTRIISGQAKGRRIETPSGDRTRPTSDQVREALFNSLAPMAGDLDDMHFLDLYAGSGAVGLEALSRGAASAAFVESHVPTTKIIAKNSADLGYTDRVKILRASVPTFVEAKATNQFDMIFIDPPYELGDDVIATILTSLVENGWLAPSADIVLERDRRNQEVPWPAQITAGRVRKYGSTVLCYGQFL